MDETQCAPRGGLISQLLEVVERVPRPVIAVIGLALVYLIGYVDYRTGIDLSPQVAYLVPVGVVSWCVGHRAGYFVAVNTAIVRLLADYITVKASALGFVPQWNAGSHFVVAIVFASILASLRARLEHEAILSRTDALTQVSNFRSFIERAEVEIERARRRRHSFAVVYMDCDNFKHVNDNLGHTTGDALLRCVAQTMKNSVRPFDIVARMGGDEFAILLPEITTAQVPSVVERVRERLGEAMREQSWPVTFSVGVVTFEQAPGSVTDMVRLADEVMYCAKHGGKDKVTSGIYDGITLTGLAGLPPAEAAATLSATVSSLMPRTGTEPSGGLKTVK